MTKHKILDKLIFIGQILSYILLVAALVFLSTFYRTGLFVFMLILVISLPLASYISGKIAWNHLSVDVKSSSTFAQTLDEVKVSVRLHNSSFFPLPDCHIRYEITSPFYPCDKTWGATVPSYFHGTFSLDLPIQFQRCGCYQVRSMHLTAYDYLHVFRFEKDLDTRLEIHVYPPEEEVQTFEAGAYGEGFDEFEETAAKGNTSSNVTDIREYIPGDRLQKIHWKLSAKINKWMVKENEHTASNQFTVLPELYLPAATSELLEECMKNAYTMCRSLLQAGEAFFLCFYNTGSADFSNTLIQNKEQLDLAFLECFYMTPYAEEDLALSVYQRAGLHGGTLLHVTHKGVSDVVS